MYDYIGEKIKGIAMVLGWVVLGISVIVWLVCLFTGVGAVSWIALAYGILTLISTWFLYGFGQLIDDAGAMRAYLCELANGGTKQTKTTVHTGRKEKTLADLKPEVPIKAVIVDDGWICGSCQTKNSLNYSQCKKCGSFKG